VTDGGTLDLVMDTGGNRSSARAPITLIVPLFNGKVTYYDNALTYDTTCAGSAANDSDGISYCWHTLTHEFGHVLGLPDEYGEELNPEDVDPNQGTRDPRIQGYSSPKEGMPTDYRPFFTDHPAMMKNNMLPRLRHYWHHVEAFNSDAVFAKALPDRPYVLRHETLGGSGIEYVRSGKTHPYVADFADEKIPGGYGQCALFPVGQDEGVAEAMFARQKTTAATTLVAASRFDALLIVRSRIRFHIDEAIAPLDRLEFIREKFNEKIFDYKHRVAAGFRFGLTGGTKYPRIAIVIQPLFAYGRSILQSDDFKLIISNKTPPPANPFALPSVGDSVELDGSHFNVFTIMRAILGAPTAVGGVANTAPLTVADFANIAKLADSKLPGTHAPVPI
jgi:hypothetical protein